MEGEVVGSVLVGQIDVGQRGHDRARGNAEDVLGETDNDIEPNCVRCDEGVRVIGRRVYEKHDGKRAEPIAFGDEPLPHSREEKEEKEVGGVNAVTERIAYAYVLENVCVECCVGQVESEGIGRSDEDRAQKTLVFYGEGEDIGEFRSRLGRVGEFLRNEPDRAVDDGEGERDESDGDEHGKLLRCAGERVADRGNGERDRKGDGAVYAACGVEIVHAHVIGQEVCVPCRKAGGEKLVYGVCNYDQNNEPEQKLVGVGDDHRKHGNADNADGIIEELARRKDPLSSFEMLQKDRGEQIEQTSDVRNKGEDTDTGFVESIHEKKTRVEKTARKLSDESRHDG